MPADTPLQRALGATPDAFEFHQAVRLIELLGLELECAEPVGRDASSAREAAELHVHPSLAYASSSIRSCRPAAGKDDGSTKPRASLAKFEVTFAGLVGAAGILPPHYSELVLARDIQRDTTLRDFLDVLHRRTLALLHAAWRRNHFPFAFEIAAQAYGKRDGFTTALLSLVGLGGETLRRRQAVDDLAFAYNAGTYANQVRSADNMADVLTATFGVPFEVEPFVGVWFDVPEDERSTLLGRGEAPGVRHSLGGGFTLGTRVWDVASRVRLSAGPLTMGQYTYFGEETPGRVRVLAMARSFLDDSFDLAFTCTLAEGESPGVVLGGDQRLGVDSWVEHAPFPDAERVATFELSAH